MQKSMQAKSQCKSWSLASLAESPLSRMTNPNGASVSGTNEMRGQRMIGGRVDPRKDARLESIGKTPKKAKIKQKESPLSLLNRKTKRTEESMKNMQMLLNV